MKLHQTGTANRRISKDGFAPAAPALARRVAQSCLKSTEIIPSTFDIPCSIFDIPSFTVSLPIRLVDSSGQRLS
jgi:hypothetical protein